MVEEEVVQVVVCAVQQSDVDAVKAELEKKVISLRLEAGKEG